MGSGPAHSLEVEGAPRVCVVGLGRLGGPFARCLASRGWSVFGADTSEEACARLLSALPIGLEAEAQTIAAQAQAFVEAGTNVAEGMENAEATFVLVGTHGQHGDGYSVDRLVQVASQVGAGLKSREAYHLVVIASTAPVGSLLSDVLPAIERASGKRAGPDFGFCYSPEFVALGDIYRGFLEPPFTLIGEHDRRSGDQLESYYQQLLGRQVRILRMSISSAEIAKLALNNFLATKVSFGNQVAALCEAVPGASTDDVTRVLAADSRIGGAFLKGATAYGGPCLPRDVAALRSLLAQHRFPTAWPDAVHGLNEWRHELLVDQVLQWTRELEAALGREAMVGVIGASFKQGCQEHEAAAGLRLIDTLHEREQPVIAFDQHATDAISPRVAVTATLDECVLRADLVVLMLPEPALASVSPTVLSGKWILDSWRTLPEHLARAAGRYQGYGRHHAARAVAMESGSA